MLANYCRAHLLLEKEYFKLKKNPLWGIDAHPINEDDFLNWHAVIKGPRETIWDGGIFRVFITFNEEYNSKPPDAFFHTIPFHPNVDMKTGRPCIDFMDDCSHWQITYDLVYVLLNLQLMLACPVLDNPVNTEAAAMFQTSPKQYQQMVLDSVYASKRFNAGLPPFAFEAAKSEGTPKDNKKIENRQLRTSQPPASKISFDEYYKTWTSIATSRPNDLSRTSAKEPQDGSLLLDQFRFGVVREDLEEELRKQLSEHNSIMYGKCGEKKNKDLEKIAELKATKAQLLQQLYFNNQGFQEDDEALLAPSVSARREDEDPTEAEVDQLVSWTSKLPEV